MINIKPWLFFFFCGITFYKTKYRFVFRKIKKTSKKIPTYSVKYVCQSNNIANEQNLTSEKEFSSKIYYCILDQVINELEKRFNNNSDI